MKYVIVEDEPIAVKRLRTLLEELRPDDTFIASVDTVEMACRLLPNLEYDLLFMDIQLADGNSFDIFDQIEVNVPLIFTTAYDEYAIKAFKQNSVDYLLKPIDPKELRSALEKYDSNFNALVPDPKSWHGNLTGKYKERFVVKVGDHLRFVESNKVQLVFSRNKATYLFNEDHRSFLVDFTMDKIEELLDPQLFFRVSRKHIINIDFIQDIVAFTNSRLEIKVKGYSEEQLIVSRERVAEFKRWLDQ